MLRLKFPPLVKSKKPIKAITVTRVPVVYVPHDPDHARLKKALGLLPRAFDGRAKAQLARIEFCNHSPMGKNSEGEYQSVMGGNGKKITRGWHCNNPLCHKAAVSKAEKFAEKYMLRAATRVKFGYHAITLKTIPDSSMSLLEAYNTANKARAAFLEHPEVKGVLRGGTWRIEVTADRRKNGDGGMRRSWFVHIHLLVDANLTKQRAALIFKLWGECVVAAGGELPFKNYAKSVERMDAYIRYMRKDISYEEWTDKELVEACKFFMAVRAPVMAGAFGTWSDRSKEGRPYAEAKRALVKSAVVKSPVGSGIDIPVIDFSDVEIVSRKTHKHKRDTVLGIYPGIKGQGMEVEQAAAAELVGASIGKFFRRLREVILLGTEVVGMKTGEVFLRGDVMPRHVPRINPSPEIQA